MRPVLTVTLNPTIDFATAVEKVEAGRKLRCDPPRLDPGGGGVNASRVITDLGGECTTLVAIAGGMGALLRELLTKSGLHAVFLDAEGMTRQSIHVYDRSRDEQLRFVFPGPVQDPSFAGKALDAVSDLLAKTEFDSVIASGSLPPGMPEDFYAEMAKIVTRSGPRLILDTAGPTLKAALGHGAYLTKPNIYEATELAEMMGRDISDVGAFARSIVEEGGVEVMIVTLKEEGTLMATKDGLVRFRSPPVEVVSPVGAGDSFAGALAFGLASGWKLQKAVAYGVAAAAAAVTKAATELANRDDVNRLAAKVTIERM